MADYYTKFSVVLPLENPEQQAYALKLSEAAWRYRTEDSPPDADFPLPDFLEEWNFNTEAEPDNVIWLHSEEGGVEAALEFIQHLLTHFKLKGCVAFEWAHDCSKPRTDAYGGGAAFVTVDLIETWNTSQFLSQVADRHPGLKQINIT